jgi:release factor glutamine methyltransferase
MKKVRGLIETAAARLEAAGIESSRWDAERLVAYQLGRDRLFLYTRPEFAVDEEAESSIEEAVRRRIRREPLQHLTGTQEFWGLTFKTGPEALIPRPESELLIEAALEFAPEASILADIGTGSGCLAVALAKVFPESEVYATDLSPGALDIAWKNAAAHRVSGRIRFMQGDLYAPLFEAGLWGTMDLLVSNPPYIPGRLLEQLQPEVRDYEPRAALDGGKDGLLFYRRLLSRAVDVLAPGGRMILELGAGQDRDVKRLASAAGMESIRVFADLAGIARVLVATSPSRKFA